MIKESMEPSTNSEKEKNYNMKGLKIKFLYKCETTK